MNSNRVRDEQPARSVGAAERSQLEQRARDAAGVRHRRVQTILEQRLEREDPGRDVGDPLQVVRLERVADLAEQPGDQAGAIDHEDRDPVRGRREEDAPRGRDRADHHDAARERQTRPDDVVGPPVAGDVRRDQRGRVNDEHIDRRDDRGRAEPGHQHRRPPDRPDDQRLKQATLAVAADHARA